MRFMIQDLIHPYVQLQNFKPVIFPECQISDSSKQYALNVMILNVFFDNPKDLLDNLDLEYYTLKTYLQQQNFIIVEDSDYKRLKEAQMYIHQKFSKWEMKIPLAHVTYNQAKIIQTYEDLFDSEKIIHTALYLIKRFCRTNFDTIELHYETCTSVGLALGGP